MVFRGGWTRIHLCGLRPSICDFSSRLLQLPLFLGVLAAATCLRGFQALSSVLPFVGSNACLSYVPQLVALSESLTRSIPLSFLVESLSDFAEGFDDDLLLCPARALRICLHRSRFVDPVCLVALLAQCLRLRYPSFTRGQSCGWGVSP